MIDNKALKSPYLIAVYTESYASVLELIEDLVSQLFQNGASVSIHTVSEHQ